MNKKIAVVIPCFRVKNQILKVISKIGPEVNRIYVVDDFCPEKSGRYVEENCKDNRVKVLYNNVNKGVGGAVIHGYQEAIKDCFSIIVKIDGDDQMDPALLSKFIGPILQGKADYTKGNRFFNLSFLREMPFVRLIGNSALSFINKVSSGYWDIMDPTNGYTAAHVSVLAQLPLSKLENRYFFESDMLFRLNTIRAVVKDIPMASRYADETSSLRVSKVLFEFPLKYLNRLFKRIFYTYFLRDFNIGTIELVFGFLLISFGLSFGFYHWWFAYKSQINTHTGTIMLSALANIFGFQLILSFLHFDIANVPRKCLHLDLEDTET